jgi:hypothetical protein
MQSELIINALKEIAKQVNGKIYEGYSGRKMFGKKCYGIECKNTWNVICMASKNKILNKYCSTATWDNLGLNCIVYFPDIEYVDNEVSACKN